MPAEAVERRLAAILAADIRCSRFTEDRSPGMCAKISNEAIQ